MWTALWMILEISHDKLSSSLLPFEQKVKASEDFKRWSNGINVLEAKI